MVSTKFYTADGTTRTFLPDFIIKSEQYCRVYLFKYDPNGIDGDIDPTTGYYIRTNNSPAAADQSNLNVWQLVDNVISFYTAPANGATLVIEIATTPEELGDALAGSAVQQAEDARDLALQYRDAANVSATNASASEISAANSATSSTSSATSASNSATIATNAATAASISESNASVSASSASTSETNASASATSAASSASNASASATSASTSATSAATSASSASTSATAAATSETNAAASAALAATFDPTSYYDKTTLDGGQLDNRYYTETEVDTALALKADQATIDALVLTPIIKPSITSPASGVTDYIGGIEVSTFETSANYNGVLDYVHFQLATDAGFTNIIDEKDDSLSLSYTPSNTQPATTYYVRVRFGSDNHLSNFSDAISFTTPAAVIYAPTITSPSNGAIDLGKNVAITTSAYDSFGHSETHLSTDWQVATDVNFTNIVDESLNDTTNLTSYTTGNLEVSTTYYVRARYKSTTYTSAYSNAISFTTKATFTMAYGVDWDESTDTYGRTGVADYTYLQSQMKRCVLNANGTVNYYLDPNDSTKKADGTAADLTGASGNVMVEIPKFYYKHTKSGSVTSISISPIPEDGYVVHPAFIRAGVEKDYRYYCAYEGYYDGNKLISRSGVTPTRSQTIDTFRTQANANGTGWSQIDWNLLYAVQLLFVTEFKSFKSQEILGNGNDSGSDYGMTTGGSNSIGNASSPASNDNTWMSYRGIENWYADVWKFIEGININVRSIYLNTDNNPATYASDTFSGAYSDTGIDFLTTSGYINGMQNTSVGFIPSAVAGSSSTYVPDYFYGTTDTSNYIVIFGGFASDGLVCGAFSLPSGLGSANSGASFGSGVAF